MINKTQTPTFDLIPTKNKEFCIIKFHAGPPYEDIAFQIVNQEWNTNRKHGFKCTFQRGILSLFFNFNRRFYRK